MNTLTDAAPRPIDEPSRILTLDVLRGVALLGIFAMNVMTFAMPFAAYFNPTAYPAVPYEGANRWVYYITHVLFDMKMMTLFSMLFGVGVVIYAEKIERGAQLSRVRWLWFKRMFILLAIGMIHAYFVWEGDILVSYAVCGIVFLWWMRRLPAWAMVLIAVPFTIGPQLYWTFGGLMYHWFLELPQPPEFMDLGEEMVAQVRTDMDSMREDFAPNAEEIAALESSYRGGYLDNLRHRVPMVAEMQLMFIPMFILWRGTAMMLLGAALYKWRVVTGERSVGFYALFALANYAVAFPLIIGGVMYNEAQGFSPGLLLAVGAGLNGIGSIPMAMGHMGLIILLTKALSSTVVVRALSAVGRMALTNYLMQSIIGSLVFYGIGLGLYGTMSRLEQQGVVLAVWIAQLIWSPLWLAKYRFGPMEWVWRTLTYGKRPAMRRAS